MEYQVAKDWENLVYRLIKLEEGHCKLLKALLVLKN